MPTDNDQSLSDRIHQQALAVLKRRGPSKDRLPDRIDNILEQLQLKEIELELQREELEAARRELANLGRDHDSLQNDAPVGCLSPDAGSEALVEVHAQRYHAVSREAKIGVWEVILSDGHLVIDDAIKAILGYTPDELGSNLENWLDLFHPDERAGLQKAIEDARSGRLKAYDARHRLFHKDGSIRWFHARGSVGVTNVGQPEKVLGTYQDITELREIENALERTHFAMEMVQEGQYWMRPDGSIADCNASACRTLGYSREELLSLSVPDIDPNIPRDFYPAHFEEMRQVGSMRLESVHRTRQGHEFPVEIYATYLGHGGEEYVCSLVRDITERKRIQLALTASEEKYRSLVERAQDGIAIVGEGLLKFVNPSLAQLIGYTVEEVLGESFDRFIAPDQLERVKANHRARMAGEDVPQVYESAIIHREGHRVEIEYNTAVIEYDGKPAGLTYVRDITERRKAEKQQRLLSSIVKQSGEGISLVDENDVLQFVNRAYAELHGYEPEEMIGRPVSICHTPEQEKRVAEARDVLFRNGSFQGELCHVRRDGSTFPAWMHMTVLRDDAGNFVGVVALLRDITDRRTIETLQRIQSGLAFSLGSARDMEPTLNLILKAVLSLDGVDMGSIHEVGSDWKSVRMMAQVGFSDELAGQAAQMELPDNAYGRQVLSGFPVYGRRGEVLENMAEAEEREGIRSLAIVPVWHNNQALAAMWLASKTCEEIPSSVRHIVESVASQIGAIIARVRAEAALKKSEKRYRVLFDSVMEGIGVVDEEERIVYCNPAMAAILEEDSPQALVGKCILDIIPERQRARILAETEKRMRGESSQYEQEVVTAKGIRKYLYLSVTPRFDDSGKYIGALGAVMDITETRRLRKLAERARRLETAGQVAGQVAHDFNNLLGPLLAYPELIRAELGSDHGALRYLQDIEAAATQMADINQQLLTLGRRGHYNQKPLNLNRLIRQMTERSGRLPDAVKLELRLDDDLMNIKGGEAQLHRVLANLIANAVDAMAGTGQLTITSENYYVDTQHRSYYRVPRGEYVKVTITDTGDGIPDEIAPKIFDPFFTTKQSDRKRGSGLGLSVVHAVIKDHNGHIDVRSEPGRGTSFYLYFPITREAEEAAVPPELIGGSESILVVDDDGLQRDVSTALLARLGYKVTAAKSGEEAVSKMAEERFDLLVLDMIMPPGMDGADTFEAARRLAPKQRAIIVSGFAETDRVQRAQGLGAGEFVKKPLSVEMIARAVRAELDRPDD